MANILDWVRERFTRIQPLPAGTHHYQSPPDGPAYRLHLRLNPDGTGMLIVNAATVLHLNPTAAEYAYHMMKGTAPEEVALPDVDRLTHARMPDERPALRADLDARAPGEFQTSA